MIRMKLKKITCILLSLLLIISLSGCIGKAVPAGINDEGRFVYAIVRGADANADVTDAAKTIRSALKNTFDVSINFTKDSAVEDTKKNYEILVGDTNREESAIALQRLRDNRENNYNDFIVAVIKDKICIQATNTKLMPTACEWFASTFCNSPEDWQKLKSNYEFIYTHEIADLSHVNKCNKNDIGIYSIVIPRYSSYLYGMVAEEIETYHKSIGYPCSLLQDIETENELEILIGNTNREASNSVSVEGDNYIIKVIGKKVVVKGGNDLATREGALRLYEEITKGNETKAGFNWSDGYTINGKYEGTKKSDYTLNFFDEFESANIDYDKWGDYNNYANKTELASHLGGTLYWQNCYGESAYTGDGMMDLMYTSDGKLHLVTQYIGDKNFGGALISTYPTMIYRYGLIEIRAKIAKVPAAVSLWQNGAQTTNDNFKHWGNQNRTAMTEIDIFEDYGGNDYFTSTIHKWWSRYDSSGKYTGSGHKSLSGLGQFHTDDNNVRYTYPTEKYGDKLIDDFHLFSCYWDGTKIKFAIDGKKYLTYDFLDVESVSLHCLMNYVIMSCRMGQAGYSTTYDPNLHDEVCEAQIDYVRLYQREDQSAQMLRTTTEKRPDDREITVRYPNNPMGNAY